MPAWGLGWQHQRWFGTQNFPIPRSRDGQAWAGRGPIRRGGPCWAPWGHGLLSPGRGALSSDSPQGPPLSPGRARQEFLRPTGQPPLSIRLSIPHPRAQVGSLRGRGMQGGADYRECRRVGGSDASPPSPSPPRAAGGLARAPPPPRHDPPQAGGHIQLPKGTLLGAWLPLPTFSSKIH